MRTLATLSLAAMLSALFLAGCGGSSDGGSTNPPATSQLAFAGNAAYNGLTSPLANPSATSADVDGKTTVTLSASGRTVKVAFPAAMAAGTYDLATSGGVRAIYFEASRAGGGTWSTIAGTLNVTQVGTNRWDLKLENARFAVDGSIDGNPATGEFTMTGTAAGVPYTVVVGPGGDGAFMISGNSTGADLNFTPTYFLKSIANGLVSAGAVRIVGETTTNGLIVNTADAVGEKSIGDVLVSATYTLGGGGTAKTWNAESGKIEVQKTGTVHKFILKNVVFKPEADTGAVGGFTLSGSFQK